MQWTWSWTCNIRFKSNNIINYKSLEIISCLTKPSLWLDWNAYSSAWYTIFLSALHASNKTTKYTPCPRYVTWWFNLGHRILWTFVHCGPEAWFDVRANLNYSSNTLSIYKSINQSRFVWQRLSQLIEMIRSELKVIWGQSSQTVMIEVFQSKYIYFISIIKLQHLALFCFSQCNTDD